MRDQKHGAPAYQPPIIRAEYVGMRQIAKRLGWSVNRVYREKRRNPMFPIFRRPTKEHWNYVMLEQRLQAWQLLTEMEATEHIKTTRTGEKRRTPTRGLATGDSPPSGATGEPGPASREATPAAYPPGGPRSPHLCRGALHMRDAGEMFCPLNPMDQQTSKPTAPETPAFTLTEGQLRKLIREEVKTAIIAVGNRNPKAESGAGPKVYLTVKEAADFARVAPSTIRLYIRKRQLGARKVGRRVIVAKGDLEDFLGRNPWRYGCPDPPPVLT